MQTARIFFESIYGELPKATFIYNKDMVAVWQNAAADSYAVPTALIEAEGRTALENMRGCAISKENVLYSLIPQEMSGERYLAVQAERDRSKDQQVAKLALRHTSAKLNYYLNDIYGSAQMLGMESGEGAIIATAVRRILRMRDHLHQLFDSELEIDYPAPLHTESYLQEYVRAVRELKSDLDLEIEAVDPHLYMQVVPQNMELILSVLVSNAQRFGDGKIALRARKDEGRACIEVLSGGEEIAEPSRVFEWCYRTTDKNGATGLGFALPSAKRLVEMQGGTIEYQRVDGRNCFRILLPFAASETLLAEWSSDSKENSLAPLRIELSDIL